MLIPIPCVMPGVDQTILIQSVQDTCPAPYVLMIPIPTAEALKAMGVMCEYRGADGMIQVWGNGQDARDTCRIMDIPTTSGQ